MLGLPPAGGAAGQHQAGLPDRQSQLPGGGLTAVILAEHHVGGVAHGGGGKSRGIGIDDDEERVIRQRFCVKLGFRLRISA